MKKIKKDRVLFSSGLLCTSASVVVWNFHGFEALQGFLLGLGFVLTVYGYVSIKKRKQVC